MSKKSSSKSNSKDDSSDDDIKGYLKGKLKDKVIKDLVDNSLMNLKCLADSKKNLTKTKFINLAKKPEISNDKGVTHVKIRINILKDADIQEAYHMIQDQIESTLLVTMGHIPFDIQVKVESRI